MDALALPTRTSDGVPIGRQAWRLPDACRVQDALEFSVVTSRTVVMIEPGAAPVVKTRHVLAEHLRATGLPRIARGLERFFAPPGTVAILLVDDDGPRIRALPFSANPPEAA